MAPNDFTGWHKSSFSDKNGGDCVEVGYAPGHVAVRDTKNRSLPARVFTAEGWAKFVAGVKRGEFDL